MLVKQGSSKTYNLRFFVLVNLVSEVASDKIRVDASDVNIFVLDRLVFNVASEETIVGVGELVVFVVDVVIVVDVTTN